VKKRLKIAIVVQGRFHAFDLARALIARGHDVTVFTNYPGWAAARFGLPTSRVRSFVAHGVAARLTERLSRYTGLPVPEAWLHSAFGRWASRDVGRESWDVIHCWSGVSEELLASRPANAGVTILMRGSAHVDVHRSLLEDEQRRTGVRLEMPSDWMVARERREYGLADHIAALSTFARDSFLSQGVSGDHVSTLSLGVDLSAFRPARDVIDRRCARIAGGSPLRVLYAGAVSFQKGLWDLLAATRALVAQPIEFTLVGVQTREARPLLSELGPNVRSIGPVPQNELPHQYARSDVFLYPTIQDGFSLVLAQATASGLPAIATTNCSAPDLLREGSDGWVLPIRRPDLIVERLAWCLSHRLELAEMVRRAYEHATPRDWSEVAADFEMLSARLGAAAGVEVTTRG
jgi:glycosyltransferase involved in cell wall biosynthesis